MVKKIPAFMVAMMFSTLPATSFAMPISVDGSVADWGINLGAATAIGYLDANKPAGASVDVVTEDNANASSSWVQVGPGYTDVGNRYDAEAMYFDNDATRGYIAIITGTSLSTFWGPGDIAIDVTSATANLRDYTYNKIQGPVPFEYGINVTGATHTLQSVSTWRGVNYDGNPSPNYGALSNPYQILTGTTVGQIAFSYLQQANSHYVIETSFLLADLGLSIGDTLDIKWTMACGNDFLKLTADIDAPPPPPNNPVPEPATMILFGTGLAGLAGFGNRARKKNKQ